MLVVPGLVKAHGGIQEIGARRRHLKLRVLVTAPLPFRRRPPRGRLGERVQPLPKDELRRQKGPPSFVLVCRLHANARGWS